MFNIRRCALFSVLALSAYPALATTIYSENFSGFDGSGFAINPNTGQLHSEVFRVTGLSHGDGTFAATYDIGDFARGSSNGGVTTGGVYAFDISNGNGSPNVALGIQQTSSDLTPGDISLRIINQSSATIHSIDIQFDLFELNNAGRSSVVEFEYAMGDENSYNSLAVFNSNEAADANASWAGVLESISLSSINWAAADPLFLRWSFDDLAGSGSRDEFAIDNITVVDTSGTNSRAIVLSEPGLIFVTGLALLVLSGYSTNRAGVSMRSSRMRRNSAGSLLGLPGSAK
ncbi:MAG: hypothetical protein JKX83_01435 [Pseudomonadales bacterium]|nr:hypothetical protein [Pseudomonadales bacterium]